MEFLTINLTGGKVKETTWLGRRYRVAPASLIVEGVLAGNKGRLYYPSAEMSREPTVWNGMPLVAYHPQVNGVHVSARSPDIFEQQGLGYLFNSDFVNGNQLTGEAWFDVELTENFDKKLDDEHKIMPRLMRGEPIELSTGLYSDTDAEPGVFNNVEYDAVARNYRPDHIAVLPDQVGACSIKDGCGINVNTCGCPVCNAHDLRSQSTGKFKKLGSGTGKGPAHEAAQAGAAAISDDDQMYGLMAKAQHMDGSSYPNFVADHGKWDASKRRANEAGYEGDERYWATVAHIYRGLGGAIATDDWSDAMPLTANQRKELVDYLVANCDCWTAADRETLNQFADPKLIALKQHAERSAITANALVQVAKVAKIPSETPADKVPAYLTNLLKTKKKGKKTKVTTNLMDDEEIVDPAAEEEEEVVTAQDEEEEEEEELPFKKKPPVQNRRSITERLLPEELEVWNAAVEVNRRAKSELILKLVGNVRDKELRKRLVTNHMKKSLQQLRDEVAALPVVNHLAETELESFWVPPQTPITANAADDDVGVLELPVVNYGATN